MAISEQDWQEEQSRVSGVTSKIQDKISQLEANVGDIRDVVIDMRKDFWDEVTVNFSNPDDLAKPQRICVNNPKCWLSVSMPICNPVSC